MITDWLQSAVSNSLKEGSAASRVVPAVLKFEIGRRSLEEKYLNG